MQHSASFGCSLARSAGRVRSGFLQVYLDGELVDYLDRSHPKQVTLPALAAGGSGQLQILVHAMGRDSGGCYFDLKGLVAPVSLNGVPCFHRSN